MGDSAILVEFGKMQLDFAVQVQIHAFEAEVRRRVIHGIWFLAPSIRSTMVSDISPSTTFRLANQSGRLGPLQFPCHFPKQGSVSSH